jgi:hypothetical protein
MAHPGFELTKAQGMAIAQYWVAKYFRKTYVVNIHNGITLMSNAQTVYTLRNHTNAEVNNLRLEQFCTWDGEQQPVNRH